MSASPLPGRLPIRVIIYKKNSSTSKSSPSKMQTATSNGMEVHALSQEADLVVHGCAASAIVFVAWSNDSEHRVHTFSKQGCKNL